MLADPRERVDMIRRGVEAKLITEASGYYDMRRESFVRIIGISDATAGRKIKSKSRLGPVESERLIRIAMIEAEAEDVFGSSEAAKHWMLSKNLALGESPLSFLDTDAGAIEVRKVLSSIAYGAVA